jgi:hypothetical protein
MSNSSISVVFAIKNGLKNGYCFWESLQSCLPLADELIISDGYSQDGTYEALLKFKDKYCKNIPTNLYQDEWEEKSYHGEVIAKVSQRAIDRATKEWILMVQADEIYHPLTIDYIKEIATKPYNAISFPFLHFLRALRPSNDGYKEAIRMVRRSKNVKLKGDGWSFDSVEPICPSSLCKNPVFHLAWIFPKCNDIKDIEHAKLYENFPCYKEKMQLALKSLNQPKKPYPIDPNFGIENFPPLARRFIGAVEYTLPENI